MLACRFCRVNLAAEKGCAKCNPLRRNLISVDEVEMGPGGDRPALSSVAGDALAALRERLRYYRNGLKEMPTSETLTKGVIAVANALSKLLESARRLQEDGLAAVQNMSYIERAELFIGWYAALPPAYRANLREKMAGHEAALERPVAANVLALAKGSDGE